MSRFNYVYIETYNYVYIMEPLTGNYVDTVFKHPGQRYFFKLNTNTVDLDDNAYFNF